MINRAYLPKLVRRRLSDVLLLQMTLLRYAASAAALKQSDCADYINQIARFHGGGEEIAKWVWRVPDKRLEPLKQFAYGPADQKNDWTEQLCSEVVALLRQPNKTTKLTPHVGKVAAPWQSAAATFLLEFYNMLTSSNRALPKYFFSDTDANRFSRQDLLDEFVSTNRDLVVCPACDESRHHVRAKGIRRSDLDHYFPKSLYPHLVCHPYNLIPICSYCNGIKSDTDPLEDAASGTKRTLGDVPLPYRDNSGLASWTFLDVELSGSIIPTKFQEIKPQGTTYMQSGVETVHELYDIPARWDEDTIGEQFITRRLFDWLEVFPISFDERPAFIDGMDYFLSTLSKAQGKEPFAFAMTWWVAALINEEDSDIEISSQNRLSPLATQFREYRDFAEQGTSMADSTAPHSPVELFDRPSVRLAIEAARGLRAITMTSV